jgi:beta-1,4-mannosyl-glycoprotein beta-1,4-N-acetylglucosaminyltransferase
MHMTKIYDCFTFYNELDLLEFRLEELYDHVDHFVIVEANRTFQNNIKPMYFEANRSRFAKYLDKIVHVTVTDMPEDTDVWGRERHQRDAIVAAVSNADSDDIIIVSDLDEIIRPDTITKIKNDDDNSIWGLRMPIFYFKFNYMLTTTDSTYTTWAMACRKGLLTSAEELRRNRFALNGFSLDYNHNGVHMMEHAGWQFSYLGDTEFAKAKIQSFSHVETNNPSILNNLDVERSIAHGNGLVADVNEKFVAVQVDNYMPLTLQKNLEKYNKYVVPDASKTVKDFITF